MKRYTTVRFNKDIKLKSKTALKDDVLTISTKGIEGGEFFFLYGGIVNMSDVTVISTSDTYKASTPEAQKAFDHLCAVFIN